MEKLGKQVQYWVRHNKIPESIQTSYIQLMMRQEELKRQEQVELPSIVLDDES
jgi:hypothetical protein